MKTGVLANLGSGKGAFWRFCSSKGPKNVSKTDFRAIFGRAKRQIFPIFGRAKWKNPRSPPVNGTPDSDIIPSGILGYLICGRATRWCLGLSLPPPLSHHFLFFGHFNNIDFFHLLLPFLNNFFLFLNLWRFECKSFLCPFDQYIHRLIDYLKSGYRTILNEISPELDTWPNKTNNIQ